jgi:hypothetical protein
VTTRAIGRTSKLGRRVERSSLDDRARVDVLVLHVNGVVILAILIHIGVKDASDRHIEGLALVIARGTTLDRAAGGPGTLVEWASSRAIRMAKWASTGTKSRTGTTVTEAGRRVDILVLDLDGVVVLVVLIHVCVSVNVRTVWASESPILVFSRRTAHNGATNMGRVETSRSSLVKAILAHIHPILFLMLV